MSSPAAATKPSPFEFSGGALCLDFVNTLGDRPRCREEKLHQYGDLLRWAAEAGIVETDEERQLASRGERMPGRARETLRRAVELREELYRIFRALIDGERLDLRDLVALNRALSDALPHRLLTPGDGRLHWSWKRPASRLDRLLWPVVRSAADLLASNRTALLRECASDKCSWMFLDRSRTRRRRWCDMKICGNRAKARRHYRRSKRAGTG